MKVPRGKVVRFPDHVYQGLVPTPSVCRTPGCLFSEPQQRGGGVESDFTTSGCATAGRELVPLAKWEEPGPP